MLGMEIMPKEAEDFDRMRNKYLDTMVMPESLAKFCDALGIVDLQGLKSFRKDKIKEMMPFVLEQIDCMEMNSTETFSNEDVELVTRAVLTAIMFAGGLGVPDVIYKVQYLRMIILHRARTRI